MKKTYFSPKLSVYGSISSITGIDTIVQETDTFVLPAGAGEQGLVGPTSQIVCEIPDPNSSNCL